MDGNATAMTRYPRPDVLAARDAGIAVNFTGAIFATAFLALETRSVLRKRKAAFAAARRHGRTPRCGGLTSTDAVLSTVTALSLWLFCQSVAWWWLDWNPAACDRFISAIPLAYLIVKQATYILLTERVRTVHKALAMNSLAFRAFRGVVYLTVWLGVPVVFWPFVFLYFGGSVTPEGICVQYSREFFSHLHVPRVRPTPVRESLVPLCHARGGPRQAHGGAGSSSGGGGVAHANHDQLRRRRRGAVAACGHEGGVRRSGTSPSAPSWSRTRSSP